MCPASSPEFRVRIRPRSRSGVFTWYGTFIGLPSWHLFPDSLHILLTHPLGILPNQSFSPELYFKLTSGDLKLSYLPQSCAFYSLIFWGEWGLEWAGLKNHTLQLPLARPGPGQWRRRTAVEYWSSPNAVTDCAFSLRITTLPAPNVRWKRQGRL